MILNCNGIPLNLSKPQVMGILNVTPDSFYDGNKFQSTSEINDQIDVIFDEGAKIIDIGGMSSRPGAAIITPEMEWERINTAIEYVKSNYPDKLISIDTLHSKTAKTALDAGVHIINDISGGHFDENMLRVVAHSNAAYVIMHMRNSPAEMQKMTNYENGIMVELLSYFNRQIDVAEKAGIVDVIIDPGFGFAKSIDQNYYILNQMSSFKILEKALLVGISRKSSVYKTLGSSPKEALNGTTALHMKALLGGAKILRVHDVKEAKEVIVLFQKIMDNRQEPK